MTGGSTVSTAPPNRHGIVEIGRKSARSARKGRDAGDIIEIGNRLIEVRKTCEHGEWLPWLDREFG